MNRRNFLTFSTSRPPLSPAQLYSQAMRPYPIEREMWQLTLSGLIQDGPHMLDWSQLQGLHSVEARYTLENAGNPPGGPYINTARWRGLRLQEVLNAFSLLPEATHARLTAANGYQTTVPLATLKHPAALLAYAMNGQLLSHEEGYPLRVILPGLYEYKMPRWITEIEFIDRDTPGFWESRGWASDGIVKTRAAITHPVNGAKVGQKVRLMGYAFAGLHQITDVQLHIDWGAPIPAALVREGAYMWTKWFLDWEPALPGYYEILALAYDSFGAAPAVPERFGLKQQEWPTGHRIAVEVRP
jgi:DMSO/TMAO reductase YedYZ molybdopterin-dependent catalytic subunit